MSNWDNQLGIQPKEEWECEDCGALRPWNQIFYLERGNQDRPPKPLGTFLERTYKILCKDCFKEYNPAHT